MSESVRAWMEEWSTGVRVWVERAGQALAGPGRLALLESIDETRSISAAARKMGMSYRHAWRMVQQINAAAGEALVSAATGGTHGGGASLTERGRCVVTILRSLQSQTQRTAHSLLRRLLEEDAVPSLRVFAAISLEDVLEQLLADYSVLQPGTRVRAVFAASDELREQILGGATADLFLAADPNDLKDLGRNGLVDAATIGTFAENTLAVVGSSRLRISIRSPRDLVGTSAARVALAAENCPLGRYTRRFLDRNGIARAVSERAVVAENARAVLSTVQAGQADIGLAYRSAAARAPGCRLLFGVPRTRPPIQYAGGVIAGSRKAEHARNLLTFLQSRTAADRFRRCGFLVPGSAASA